MLPSYSYKGLFQGDSKPSHWDLPHHQLSSDFQPVNSQPFTHSQTSVIQTSSHHRRNEILYGSKQYYYLPCGRINKCSSYGSIEGNHTDTNREATLLSSYSLESVPELQHSPWPHPLLERQSLAQYYSPTMENDYSKPMHRNTNECAGSSSQYGALLSSGYSGNIYNDDTEDNKQFTDSGFPHSNILPSSTRSSVQLTAKAHKNSNEAMEHIASDSEVLDLSVKCMDVHSVPDIMTSHGNYFPPDQHVINPSIQYEVSRQSYIQSPDTYGHSNNPTISKGYLYSSSSMGAAYTTVVDYPNRPPSKHSAKPDLKMELPIAGNTSQNFPMNVYSSQAPTSSSSLIDSIERVSKPCHSQTSEYELPCNSENRRLQARQSFSDQKRMIAAVHLEKDARNLMRKSYNEAQLHIPEQNDRCDTPCMDEIPYERVEDDHFVNSEYQHKHLIKSHDIKEGKLSTSNVENKNELKSPSSTFLEASCEEINFAKQGIDDENIAKKDVTFDNDSDMIPITVLEETVPAVSFEIPCDGENSDKGNDDGGDVPAEKIKSSEPCSTSSDEVEAACNAIIDHLSSDRQNDEQSTSHNEGITEFYTEEIVETAPCLEVEESGNDNQIYEYDNGNLQNYDKEKVEINVISKICAEACADVTVEVAQTEVITCDTNEHQDIDTGKNDFIEETTTDVQTLDEFYVDSYNNETSHTILESASGAGDVSGDSERHFSSDKNYIDHSRPAKTIDDSRSKPELASTEEDILFCQEDCVENVISIDDASLHGENPSLVLNDSISPTNIPNVGKNDTLTADEERRGEQAIDKTEDDVLHYQQSKCLTEIDNKDKPDLVYNECDEAQVHMTKECESILSEEVACYTAQKPISDFVPEQTENAFIMKQNHQTESEVHIEDTDVFSQPDFIQYELDECCMPREDDNNLAAETVLGSDCEPSEKPLDTKIESTTNYTDDELSVRLNKGYPNESNSISGSVEGRYACSSIKELSSGLSEIHHKADDLIDDVGELPIAKLARESAESFQNVEVPSVKQNDSVLQKVTYNETNDSLSSFSELTAANSQTLVTKEPFIVTPGEKRICERDDCSTENNQQSSTSVLELGKIAEKTETEQPPTLDFIAISDAFGLPTQDDIANQVPQGSDDSIPPSLIEVPEKQPGDSEDYQEDGVILDYATWRQLHPNTHCEDRKYEVEHDHNSFVSDLRAAYDGADVDQLKDKRTREALSALDRLSMILDADLATREKQGLVQKPVGRTPGSKRKAKFVKQLSKTVAHNDEPKRKYVKKSRLGRLKKQLDMDLVFYAHESSADEAEEAEEKCNDNDVQDCSSKHKHNINDGGRHTRRSCGLCKVKRKIMQSSFSTYLKREYYGSKPRQRKNIQKSPISFDSEQLQITKSKAETSPVKSCMIEMSDVSVALQGKNRVKVNELPFSLTKMVSSERKRKLGRPKKNPCMETTAAIGQPPKRKRGRPKKVTFDLLERNKTQFLISKDKISHGIAKFKEKIKAMKEKALDKTYTDETDDAYLQKGSAAIQQSSIHVHRDGFPVEVQERAFGKRLATKICLKDLYKKRNKRQVISNLLNKGSSVPKKHPLHKEVLAQISEEDLPLIAFKKMKKTSGQKSLPPDKGNLLSFKKKYKCDSKDKSNIPDVKSLHKFGDIREKQPSHDVTHIVESIAADIEASCDVPEDYPSLNIPSSNVNVEPMVAHSSRPKIRHIRSRPTVGNSPTRSDENLDVFAFRDDDVSLKPQSQRSLQHKKTDNLQCLRAKPECSPQKTRKLCKRSGYTAVGAPIDQQAEATSKEFDDEYPAIMSDAERTALTAAALKTRPAHRAQIKRTFKFRERLTYSKYKKDSKIQSQQEERVMRLKKQLQSQLNNLDRIKVRETKRRIPKSVQKMLGGCDTQDFCENSADDEGMMNEEADVSLHLGSVDEDAEAPLPNLADSFFSALDTKVCQSYESYPDPQPSTSSDPGHINEVNTDDLLEFDEIPALEEVDDRISAENALKKYHRKKETKVKSYEIKLFEPI